MVVKMKSFYLMCFLLLFINGTWCYVDKRQITEELDYFVLIAKGLLETSCREVGTDEVSETVREAIEDLKFCLENVVHNDAAKARVLKRSPEGVCLDLLDEYVECFHDLLDIWRYCSIPEAKFYPDFLQDSADALVGYLCANNARALIKLYQPNAFDCAMKGYIPLVVCLLKTIDINLPDNFLTKSNLCLTYPKVAACFVNHIEDQCPHDPTLRNMVEGYWNAMSSPCRRETVM